MELSFLDPVYRHTGPFATAYLNVSRDSEDADHEIEVRWRKARAELASNGAGESALQAIDEVVGRSHGEPAPCGQVIVAGSDSLALDILVAHPPQDQVNRFAPLPHLMPYLAGREPYLPHTLVVVDSIGADLRSVDASGRRHWSRVEGGDHPTHKPREGREHHKQMQRAVEEQVKHNIDLVVAEVDRQANIAGAALIAVAGEVQTRSALLRRLSESAGPAIVEIESGSRASGSESSSLEQELSARLADATRAQLTSVMDIFEHERGNADRGGRATEGMVATTHALRAGQVDTLLLTDQAAGDTELWVGSEPHEIGFTVAELEEIGATTPELDRADSAWVRAAAATSADLVLAPPGTADIHEGIAAVLRYSARAIPL